MFRVFLFALLVAAGFAQTAPPPAAKPPAEVDRALRARVNEFYTLLKNREYRKAEALVAEDTKDYYYDGSKPEVNSFEIVDVLWTDQFTQARVTTQCAQMLVIPGFPATEVKLRVPTTWKLENGDWYVFVDQSRLLSPVGLPLKPPSGAPAPGIPKEIPQTPAFALGKLQADKQTVLLAPGASEQVTFTNNSAGFMQIQLGYPLAGIEAKLDRSSLNHGDKAILTLQAGQEPKPGTYSVRIIPTQEVVNINVQVK